LEETVEKGKVWLKMSDIKKPAFSFADYIPSGITELDRRGVGFKRGMVSVWTGKRGCGKSSLLNMLILNSAQKGYKSALWTGELTCDTAKTWLYLQAAGKQYNERQYGTDYYSTPDNISAKIDGWIDKYFWLFNNKYGENFSQIEEQIRRLKDSENIDVVLLDNLMVLDLRSLDENKYDRQSVLLQKLTDLAKELNIHIHLVAHPHKSLAYIQVDNISGSGDISNKADNVFVLSRVDTGFRSVADEYLGKIVYQDVINSGCSNIIEVGKFRSKGTLMGMVIKLWFEEESNRLKNNIAEQVRYGWEEEPHQQTINYYQPRKEEEIINAPYDPNEIAPF
jgi:twinkle protein